MAEHPVDDPRRHLPPGRNLLEGDAQLVDRVSPPFIDPWSLAGGTDEGTRKQIGQRGVVVPITHQAPQQVGAAQERAVGGGRPPQHDVVASPRPGMGAVTVKPLGGEPRLARVVVDTGGDGYQLVPIVRGMDVDFEHPRIGGDGNTVQPRIARRRVTLDHQTDPPFARGILDGSDQLQIVLEQVERRHEHVQPPLPRFNAQRRPDYPLGP